MTRPRSSPFVHATWLSKLLVGQNSCEWAIWFQAHFEKYKKNESDLAQWHIDHAGLLSQTRARLLADGYDVLSESETEFSVTGSRTRSKLKGQPDLIVLGDRPVICEVKAAKPSHSHRAQLLLYMYGVPRADDRRFSGMKFDGLLVYPDHMVEVSSKELDPFVPHLLSLLGRIVSDAPAAKVSSWRECRFCKLTSEDCVERVNEEPSYEEDEPVNATEDF